MSAAAPAKVAARPPASAMSPATARSDSPARARWATPMVPPAVAATIPASRGATAPATLGPLRETTATAAQIPTTSTSRPARQIGEPSMATTVPIPTAMSTQETSTGPASSALDSIPGRARAPVLYIPQVLVSGTTPFRAVGPLFGGPVDPGRMGSKTR